MNSDTPKADASDTSINDSWGALRSAIDCATRAKMIEPRKVSSPATPNRSRDIVRNLLSSLAPQAAEPPVLSKDLERLSRVIKSVIQAADEDILTASEADAIIRFIGECFAVRRMDEIFSRVTKPSHGNWFILHGHAEEK